jgi:hypothetical protein
MKNTLSAPATSRRLRRLVTRSVLAFVLAVGTLVGTATPAEAASGVKACFVHENGTPAWGVTAELQVWLGAWYPLLSMELGPAGCAYWSIDPGAYGYSFRIVANHRVGQRLVVGMVWVLGLSGRWVCPTPDGCRQVLRLRVAEDLLRVVPGERA